MKNITKKLIYGLMAAVMLTACDPSDFGDLNVNPNATKTPVTSALLTNVLSGIYSNTSFYTERCLYAQYLSNSQYPEGSQYQTITADFSGYYSGSGYDLQNIININSDEATKSLVLANGSNNNQIAVAKILKVALFSVVTDTWGDVPYSESMKKLPTPKYDTQQAIYQAFFKELKEAVAQFDNGKAVTGDILFAGNAAKWKKYANSLRMILALRLSKVDPATGKAEFAAALTDPAGHVATNADNVVYAFLDNNDFRNPWQATWDGRDDFGVSDVFIKALQDRSDPRIVPFADKTAAGTYVGIPYGLRRDLLIQWTNKNPQYSRPSVAKFRTKNAPGYIITAAQMLLTRAEAAQIGWTTEDASKLYNDAIKASWEQWGVYDAATYTKYISDPANDLKSTTGKALEKIGSQKWIALYPNGQEAWSEWRRTGYPALTPTPYAVNVSKQIPRRYGYPASEATLNKASNAEAVARIQGGDTHDGRVWWDKQ